MWNFGTGKEAGDRLLLCFYLLNCLRVGWKVRVIDQLTLIDMFYDLRFGFMSLM